MAKFILKRLMSGLLVLFGVIVVVFILQTVIPADPARSWVGQKATAEQLARARVELGLDKPIWTQFITYIKNLIHGNLGVSYTTKRAIADELAEKIPATFELVFYGALIGVISGLIMGVLAAKHKDKFIDHLVRFISIGFNSCPGFVLAIILQLIFYRGLNLLPLGDRVSVQSSIMYTIPDITGWLTIDSLLVGNMKLFKDAVQHLILPALCIAPYIMGTVARMTRSTLVEVLSEDYILAARSYGIKEKRVLWHSALKNSVGTTATVTALAIATQLVSTFLTETIFSWPGIGSFMSNSVMNLNYPAIMAGTIFTTLCYLVLNLIADIIVGLDPRVRN
jgi:peptide/nickel transport system permease protein